MTDPDAPLDDTPGRHAADRRGPSLLERWQATEPIRVALYPVAAAVVALLVGYGVVAEHRAPLWLAIVAALAGGALPVLGAEVARRQAWSPATVRATVDEWREYEFAEGYNDGLELGRREGARRAAETAQTTEAPAVEVHPPTAAMPRARREVPPSTR